VNVEVATDMKLLVRLNQILTCNCNTLLPKGGACRNISASKQNSLQDRMIEKLWEQALA